RRPDRTRARPSSPEFFGRDFFETNLTAAGVADDSHLLGLTDRPRTGDDVGCGVRCGDESMTRRRACFAMRSMAAGAAVAGAVQTRNTVSIPCSAARANRA